jgi:hypothetical protein
VQNGVLSVISGTPVTITFQNSVNPSSWEYTNIYDDFTVSDGFYSPSGNKIGELNSADGSITVTTSTGKLFIDGYGGFVVEGTITTTDGITIENKQFGGAILQYALNIPKSGTITISGVDWDE